MKSPTSSLQFDLRPFLRLELNEAALDEVEWRDYGKGVELGKLVRDGAESHEVNRVKNRRRTSLALEAEAPYHRLTQLMDDIEYFGAPRGVEQMLAAVDSVTVASIRDYLAEFSIDSGGHLARVGATAA